MNLVLAITRHLRAILLATLLVATLLRLLVNTTIATKGGPLLSPRTGILILLHPRLLLLHGRERPLVRHRLAPAMTTIGPLGMFRFRVSVLRSQLNYLQ